MRKISDFKDVVLISQLNNEIYFLLKNSIINPMKNIKLNGHYYKLECINNMVFMQEENDKNVIILDEKLCPIKTFSNSVSIGFRSLENAVILKDDGVLFLVDTSLNLTKIELSHKPIYYFCSKFILRDKNSLYSSDGKGNIHWSYTLPDNDTIDASGLCFSHNIAVIPTKNKKLIFVNLYDGSELHKLSDVPNSYLLSSNNDKLISFAGNSYGDNFLKVIDMNHAKVVHDSTFNNFFYGFRPSKSSIYKDKLYFICEDYKPEPHIDAYYTLPHLGRLDLKTYTIDWIKKIGDWQREGQIFEAPIVIDNRVYLKSLDNRAYIYELDE